jgi:hypothetical protein
MAFCDFSPTTNFLILSSGGDSASANSRNLKKEQNATPRLRIDPASGLTSHFRGLPVLVAAAGNRIVPNIQDDPLLALS